MLQDVFTWQQKDVQYILRERDEISNVYRPSNSDVVSVMTNHQLVGQHSSILVQFDSQMCSSVGLMAGYIESLDDLAFLLSISIFANRLSTKSPNRMATLSSWWHPAPAA